MAQWLRDHEKGTGSTINRVMTMNEGFFVMGDTFTSNLVNPAIPTSTSVSTSVDAPEVPPPRFQYWIDEARALLDASSSSEEDYLNARFCASKALAAAASEIEWAESTNIRGVCQLRLNNLAEALVSFSEIVTRFGDTVDLGSGPINFLA